MNRLSTSARVPSTPHGPFAGPTNIIAYFASCREGETPTDNPIIEALNGWMKKELYLDFGLATTEDVLLLLDTYVHYFNTSRSAAALGYKSPLQYKTDLGF